MAAHYRVGDEMRDAQWARLQEPARCGLRWGAWYPVMGLTPREARLWVRGHAMVVARSLLELSNTQPHEWTVARPANGAEPYVVCRPGAFGDPFLAGRPHTFRTGAPSHCAARGAISSSRSHGTVARVNLPGTS